MRDTAILLLNLGGPVNLGQVEPFLAALFGDRDLIKLPCPAFLQPPLARLIARLHRLACVIDAAAIDARRRAGLQTTDAQG